MVNASKKAGLGKTLQRAQKFASQRRNPRSSKKHTTEVDPTLDNAKLNLRSVTAQSNLDEFFEEAELAGKQFVTERRNVAMIKEDNSRVELYDKSERVDLSALAQFEIETSLSVPRRPKWTSETTPEQLDELEKVSFLAWRRKLARIQEDDSILLTPFEKNIEVWRQLWRVIERSDIIVQILDSRNPLLYLCEDLMKYVEEGSNGKKMNLVLLNKADYLTKEQRRIWWEYFDKLGIKAIFFSALLENDKLKRGNIEDSDSEQTNSESDEKSSVTDDDDDSTGCDVASQLDENLKIDLSSDPTHVYDKYELLDTWSDFLDQLAIENSNHNEYPEESKPEGTPDNSSHHNHLPTVGLVGYPNVGKSSTINALLSAKRVAVSATPGKTKHFQTFLIDRNMMLCDCPGLVFPNFVSSKSDMVINGVLPIDQMKDPISPVRLIVSKIPRAYFEVMYGLAFVQDAKQNITAEDLLNAFGFMRGYMTARGLPDISRAARKICKDFINGKILHCEPPPDFDRKLYHEHSKLAEVMKSIEERVNNPQTALKITDRQRRLMVQAQGSDYDRAKPNMLNSNKSSAGVHIKGLPGINDKLEKDSEPIENDQISKRAKKHKKREKLRIVYREMDI